MALKVIPLIKYYNYSSFRVTIKYLAKSLQLILPIYRNNYIGI